MSFEAKSVHADLFSAIESVWDLDFASLVLVLVQQLLPAEIMIEDRDFIDTAMHAI